MGNMTAKIKLAQKNNNEDREVELTMNESTDTEAPTPENDSSSQSTANGANGGTGKTEKIPLKFNGLAVALFIALIVIFIAGITCSIIFISKCNPPNNSCNFVIYIQHAVLLALALASVIITSLPLIKASKWLIKVDLIIKLLNSPCNDEQKKKFCDTLAEL